MSIYNKIKTETLGIVKDMGEATSLEVASITNRSKEASAMAMLQYFKFGLLHRHRLKGVRTFAYSISERGLERLSWLRDELA